MLEKTRETYKHKTLDVMAGFAKVLEDVLKMLSVGCLRDLGDAFRMFLEDVFRT